MHTVKALKDILDTHGIAYPKSAKKADLLVLAQHVLPGPDAGAYPARLSELLDRGVKGFTDEHGVRFRKAWDHTTETPRDTLYFVVLLSEGGDRAMIVKGALRKGPGVGFGRGGGQWRFESEMI